MAHEMDWISFIIGRDLDDGLSASKYGAADVEVVVPVRISR
jgi:hypothetical protein